ncbi:MAG: hypothetical protein NTU43_02730 [Bacteroidetes bacterium]|nr:hypothetical protein [Bacteroidota bacterium]
MTENEYSIVEKFKNQLTANNLIKYSVKDWKCFLSQQLSMKFSTKTYNYNPEYLYRARLNFNEKKEPVDFFCQSNELWAPPFKKATIQRCNLAGQSMLYCSTCATTTIFEINPIPNTEITIMEYKCSEEIKQLSILGLEQIVSINDNLKNIFGNHLNGKSEETIIIDKILSSIFKSRNIKCSKVPIYNLTNAITQIFLNKQQGDFFAKQNIGLIYPSVETKKVLGANIVMNPKVTKQILKPNIAYKYKILKAHSPHHFEILLTNKTSNIADNGFMNWEVISDPIIENITDLPAVGATPNYH